MVKALDLTFGAGTLIGSEAFVVKEQNNLQAAVTQFSSAETSLRQVIGRQVGNGCTVADYFSDAEWRLLSRASENRQLAQHQLAVRDSYMNIKKPEDLPAQRTKALDTYRNAYTAGYLELIGVAGRKAMPIAAWCHDGIQPSGLLLTDMVARLAETRAEAEGLRMGRNIFGYDPTFTPALHYKKSATNPDNGLYDLALDWANRAKGFQNDAVAAQRAFDTSQKELMAAIANPTSGLKNTLDKALYDDVSCDSNDPKDADLTACANQQIELLKACPVGGSQAEFDACVNSPEVRSGSTLLQKVKELRASWLDLAGIQQRIDNMKERIAIEHDRNATVTDTIMTNGQQMGAFEFFMTILDSFQVGIAWKVPGGLQPLPADNCRACLGQGGRAGHQRRQDREREQRRGREEHAAGCGGGRQ